MSIDFSLLQFNTVWFLMKFRNELLFALKNEKMFLKSDICLLWPATVVPGFTLSHSSECICPQKDVHKQVFSSFIHHSSKRDATQMFINRRMNCDTGTQWDTSLAMQGNSDIQQHGEISQTWCWMKKPDKRAHSLWFHSCKGLECLVPGDIMLILRETDREEHSSSFHNDTPILWSSWNLTFFVYGAWAQTTIPKQGQALDRTGCIFPELYRIAPWPATVPYCAQDAGAFILCVDCASSLHKIHLCKYNMN